MPKKKLPFKIGDRVWVLGQYTRYYNGDERTWVRELFPEQRPAVITGQSRRYSGLYEKGYYSASMWSDDGPDYEGPSLAVTASHDVWLVRFALRSAEVAVAPEDIVHMHPDYKWKLPRQGAGIITPENDRRYREYMRQEMSQWPRDERGRWQKNPPILKIAESSLTPSANNGIVIS